MSTLRGYQIEPHTWGNAMQIQKMIRKTRAVGGWLAVALLLCGGVLKAAPTAATPGAGQKGFDVDESRSLPVSDTAPPSNAALFVGVNKFTVDDGLRSLQFAVDDAIAQANLFVLELKLVTAANCYLAISGDPSSDESKRQLGELTKAGVHVVTAERTHILHALLTVKDLGHSSADIVIVSISSHGFEDKATAYAMPQDGMRGMLADSALSVTSMEQKLSESKAGKRLLLIDACREKASSDGKGADTLMTDAFHKALVEAQGQAVLASCDRGQVSYETPDFHHGVFTYYLLQALHGQATANSQGFITLGIVSDYVAKGVADWVLRNKQGNAAIQKPWFEGPKDAQEIPLAIDPGQHKKEAERVETLKQLLVGGKITGTQLDEGRGLLTAQEGLDDSGRQRARFMRTLPTDV